VSGKALESRSVTGLAMALANTSETASARVSAMALGSKLAMVSAMASEIQYAST
jgi:hypothetical protein